jgi:hypothetical protein
VTYFYFDFNDNKKQNLVNLFRSLITQLSSESALPSRALAKLYARSCDGKQPAKLFDLRDSLAEMLLEYDQLYILLDALDECTERSELLKWLDQILKQNIGRLHLFASSRREADIVEALANMRVDAVPIKNADVDSDIRVFIEDQLANRSGLSKRATSVKAEITKALLEGANGMYDFIPVDYIIALI